jgi:hypothetical protein
MRQAGRRDFRIATDTDSNFAFRIHQVGDPVAASTVQVGDWLNYRGRPWIVADIADAGPGRLKIQLGLGLWNDPSVTLDATDLVRPSQPIVIEALDAAYQPSTRVTPPTTILIPTSISGDGTVASLDFSSAWLADVQAGIDYLGDGPSQLSAPYDVIATITGQRRRVLHGTITFIRSTAARAVADPTPTGGTI